MTVQGFKANHSWNIKEKYFIEYKKIITSKAQSLGNIIGNKQYKNP